MSHPKSGPQLKLVETVNPFIASNEDAAIGKPEQKEQLKVPDILTLSIAEAIVAPKYREDWFDAEVLDEASEIIASPEFKMIKEVADQTFTVEWEQTKPQNDLPLPAMRTPEFYQIAKETFDVLMMSNILRWKKKFDETAPAGKNRTQRKLPKGLKDEIEFVSKAIFHIRKQTPREINDNSKDDYFHIKDELARALFYWTLLQEPMTCSNEYHSDYDILWKNTLGRYSNLTSEGGRKGAIKTELFLSDAERDNTFMLSSYSQVINKISGFLSDIFPKYQDGNEESGGLRKTSGIYYLNGSLELWRDHKSQKEAIRREALIDSFKQAREEGIELRDAADERVNRELKRLTAEKASLKARLEKLDKQIAPVEAEYDKYNQELKAVMAGKEDIVKLGDQMRARELRLAKLNLELNKIGWAYREGTKARKSKLGQEIEELQQQDAEAAETIIEAEKSMNRIPFLQKVTSKLQKELDELRETQKRIKGEIAALNQQFEPYAINI